MTGQKFIAFFFILHLPCKVEEVTVGSKFEVKGEDVTAVITAENKDIFWASDLCFDLMSLLYFKSVSEDDSSVSVSPCCCQLVMRCRRSNLSPTDGAELCGCVNTGDSMAWCCLGMRHPRKASCTPQSNEQ